MTFRSAVVLVALTSVSCGSRAAPDAPPPNAPSGENASGAEDEAAVEHGNEGDEETLPTVSAAPIEAGAGGAAFLAEMNRIVGRVRETTYSHATHVDEDAGRYDVDCSGLADYALMRAAPDAFDVLRSAEAKRPLAKHFVDFFANIPAGQKKGPWRRIERAADLVPGDIVAWLEPADVVSHNTGHVMIVRAPVTPLAAEVGVPIIDSTALLHGADDSRKPTKGTGVGTGTIHLLVDDTGAPVGYRWSNGKRARDHHTRVALGHIE